MQHEISAAACADARPTDSRCDVIQPPVPDSIQTYIANAQTKMSTRRPGRPGEPVATGGRPEMRAWPGMSTRATAAPPRNNRVKWPAAYAATTIGPPTAPAE